MFVKVLARVVGLRRVEARVSIGWRNVLQVRWELMCVSHDTVGGSVHGWDSGDRTLSEHVPVRLVFVGFGNLPCWWSAIRLRNPSVRGERLGFALSCSGLEHVLHRVEGIIQRGPFGQRLFTLAGEELDGSCSRDAGALSRLRARFGGRCGSESAR